MNWIEEKKRQPDRMLCDPEFKAFIKAAAASKGMTLIDYTRNYAKKKKEVLRSFDEL